MVWMWNVPHRLMGLNSWFPGGDTILGGCRTSQTQNLLVDVGPQGWFQPTLCFLTADTSHLTLSHCHAQLIRRLLLVNLTLCSLETGCVPQNAAILHFTATVSSLRSMPTLLPSQCRCGPLELEALPPCCVPLANALDILISRSQRGSHDSAFVLLNDFG